MSLRRLNDTSRKYLQTDFHVCTSYCLLKCEMFCVFLMFLSPLYYCPLRPLKRWLHAHVLQLSHTLFMVNTVNTIKKQVLWLNLTFLSLWMSPVFFPPSQWSHSDAWSSLLVEKPNTGQLFSFQLFFLFHFAHLIIFCSFQWCLWLHSYHIQRRWNPGFFCVSAKLHIFKWGNL